MFVWAEPDAARRLTVLYIWWSEKLFALIYNTCVADAFEV